MKQKEDNIIAIKSYKFAVRCVNLYKYLCEQKHDYVIGKQLLRSGTSIGANVKEAIRGISKAEFRAKMSISLKEASESEFWIELLRDTEYITKEEAESLLNDCGELLKLLMSIAKTIQTEEKQHITT
ncbi:MAG: four helix bundle protein [Prevotella sp.]|nr:four helix bundle protein [Prevotella sp.]